MYPFHGLYQKILNQENNEHRKIFFDFFIVFSRFEYTLKRVGHVKSPRGNASADWDGFASTYENVFNPTADTELHRAVDFLINNAPRKQVYRAGHLAWHDIKRDGHSQLLWTSLLIRTVRNNLFHGEKFRLLLGISSPRDYDLVQSSLVILSHFLSFSNDLPRYFLPRWSGR